VFHLVYVARELRRRLGRTLLTALGLALGVGLVIGISLAEQGVTVIVVTHAEDVARRTARRIRLRDGRVVLDPDAAWRAEPPVPDERGLSFS
jgi:hypothetical protein